MEHTSRLIIVESADRTPEANFDASIRNWASMRNTPQMKKFNERRWSMNCRMTGMWVYNSIWPDTQTHTDTHTQTDTHTNRQTDRHTYRHRYKQTDTNCRMTGMWMCNSILPDTQTHCAQGWKSQADTAQMHIKISILLHRYGPHKVFRCYRAYTW